MPKASKPPRATKPKPTKPVLSSAAKADRQERTKDYKSSKAAVLASAAPHKGPRYYDEDDADADEDNNGDDEHNNGDDEDGNGDDEGSNGSNEDKDKGNEGSGEEDRGVSKGAQPYKSKCGNYIFIPDEAGEYTQFAMLDRPEGDLKKLDELMELDGPDNKDLWKGLQSTVRTVTRHVARNIPNCTYPKLSDEHRVHITVQVRKSYPIVARYRGNWALKEMVIRALTHYRDLQARVKKAGGQAAWCEKLKAQRETKKASKEHKTKGRGKGQASGPSNTTNRAKESSLRQKLPPQEVASDLDDDAIPVSKPSASGAKKALRRINSEDSEDEAGSDDAPAPAPRESSKPKEGKIASKQAPRATSTEGLTDEDEPAPVQKQKARDASKDPSRSQKNAKAQPTEDSQDEGGSDKEPAPPSKPISEKQKAPKHPPKAPLTESVEVGKKSVPASDSSKKGNKGNKANPPVSSTIASSTPPPPATNEATEDETDLTQSTQPYPDMEVVPDASHPVTHLGSTVTSLTPEAPEAESDGSEQDVPTPPPARKRARTSPPPVASLGVTDVEPAINKGKKRKAPPINSPIPTKKQHTKGKDVPEGLTPAAKKAQPAKPSASDPKAGASSAKAGMEGKKAKRGGRQAKQELIDTADSLLGNQASLAPERTTRQTRANRG